MTAGKLESCLRDDADVALAAIEGLGAMGAKADSIARLMDHQDPRIKSAVCLSLVSSADSYASKAIRLLDDSDVYVRNSAMYLIAASTNKTTSDAGAIGALLSNPNP